MRRRELLRAGGMLLAGAAWPRLHVFAEDIIEVQLRSDPRGRQVDFEPVGLYLEPGQAVRWINVEGVHTVTSYHPDNDSRSLRIPDAAAAWDSGYLLEPLARFELRFEVPGVYDYCCVPHEAAGMVGRLVVGEISGPGSLPFDYFKELPSARAWRPVPPAAQARFPSAESIVRLGRVPAHGAVVREQGRTHRMAG